MTAAPTLQTERLTLRPMRYEDFPAFARLLGSDRARYMGGPFDSTRCWGMFCQDAASWALFGFGALMLDQRDSTETIGQVGLNAGPSYPETELGWMLYTGHEGAGYATEGARALLDWAFANLSVDSIVSYIDPDNTASQAVAKRLGGTLDADAPRPDPEDVVFRHRRPQ